MNIPKALSPYIKRQVNAFICSLNFLTSFILMQYMYIFSIKKDNFKILYFLTNFRCENLALYNNVSKWY